MPIVTGRAGLVRWSRRPCLCCKTAPDVFFGLSETSRNALPQTGDLSATREGQAPLRQTLELVTLTWVFGAVWNTTVTGAPLTRFAAELHASPWQFGLLTAMPFIGSLLSLPASLMIERTGARKMFFLVGTYLQ